MAWHVVFPARPHAGFPPKRGLKPKPIRERKEEKIDRVRNHREKREREREGSALERRRFVCYIDRSTAVSELRVRDQIDRSPRVSPRKQLRMLFLFSFLFIFKDAIFGSRFLFVMLFVLVDGCWAVYSFKCYFFFAFWSINLA